MSKFLFGYPTNPEVEPLKLDKLTISEIEDFTQRACVQLSPELTRQALSMAMELIEYKKKISEGFLIEIDKDLLGKQVIVIREYTPGGVYKIDTNGENVVIGFDSGGVLTENLCHGYTEYFKKGFYFADSPEGMFMAYKALKELQA